MTAPATGNAFADAFPAPGSARWRRLWLVLLPLVLALVLLGHRGIWDPDEGRYTNVALNMLDSGDWLNPHRSTEVGHWTKPPLTYWAIASSITVFGHDPWAARLPAALSYLLCVWLVWRIARRIVPGDEDPAALVYATMLFTLGASQIITTDYLLAACETLAAWAFMESRSPGNARPWRYVLLMWFALALAFLAKGPPGLLPLLVFVAWDWLVPSEHARHRRFDVAGVALFLLLAAPWYVAVILGNPGLLKYFIGDEVVNRVASNEFGRHGEWYGWLQVYLPTLLLGSLPWTLDLLRWARALPARARAWRSRAARAEHAHPLFIALWLLLPLVVFCAARSRLPLYVLPLFAPLAIAIAMQRRADGRGLPRPALLLAWAAALLALKFAAAYWPTHKDAADWAAAIRERAPGPVSQVAFVEDMARYGLHLHLGVGVEKLSLQPLQQPRFNPEYDEDVADEIGDDPDPAAVWITKLEAWPRVQAKLRALGYEAIPQGTPYQGRVIFRVRKSLPAA